MAQQDGKQGDVTQPDLKAHFSNYNVSVNVLAMLYDESITIHELVTFTTKDLEDWCNEHSLKTIERRRFVNAVKSLPNAQANKPKFTPVFLGNEEKEQLNEFDEMTSNVKNMIDKIKEIKDSTCVENVVQKINDVCDEIEAFVAAWRKQLLKQV